MTRTLLFLLLSPTFLLAQRNAKVPDPDPEIERKSFKLPEGFEVNLFAADPQLMKPIHMNFDAAGRLWLACSENYPQIKPGQKHTDKIIVLEDADGDGKADKTSVFADGLLIPTGLEPGDGGVYVVDSTDLLHLSDTNGDGKADKRRVVLSGFGTEDTHHLVHTLRWGPDGLLYFTQSIYIHSHIETPHGVRRLNAGGIWALRPETMQLDVFARGWINSWGHHFDRYGQSFVTDGAGGEGVNYVVPGAGYPASQGMSRILHGLNPGSPKYCGCEIVSGRHLPDDWQGNLITNDFRGNRVCRFKLNEDGTGYASRLQVDLIKSDHPAFRPVDVKMGPDGAIYIADWYNPIIQHGEVDFRDPRRDHTHGRIWRITYKGRDLVKKPKLVEAAVEDLLEQLKAPEDWTRHFAKRVLKERGKKDVTTALGAWVKKQTEEHALLEGLWTYQSLDIVEPELLRKLLNAKDHRVRAAATRVASYWLDRLEKPLELLTARVNDEHPRVRMEAVRATANLKTAKAAEVALQALTHPQDKFLDYALWLTTRDLQPLWLPALQNGEITFGGDVKALTFALQTAGSASAIKPLVEMVRNGKVSADREENVLALIAALGNPQDLQMIFDLVLNEMTTPARKVVLLEGLAQASRQRAAKPTTNLAKLDTLLASKADAVRESAARLVGLWKLESSRKNLIELATTEATSLPVRRAVCEALVSLGDKESVATLQRMTDVPFAHPVRALAVISLAGVNIKDAASRAATVLAAAPNDSDPSEIITAVINQKGGMEALTAELKEKKVPADVAKVALRVARSTGRDVNALSESLRKAGGLTALNRTLTKTQLDELLDEIAKKGSAARGETIYRRKDSACIKCHAIAGSGGQVGPDLSSIGSSAQPDYLVEAMLLPGKAIKEGFHSVVVTTDKGQLLTGIKLRETGKELVIRNAEDKEVVIPKATIEETKNGGSLMPEGLTDELTRGELIDLVRFMSELGKVGPYQVGKERYVRRWQVLEPTKDATTNLVRLGLNLAASDADWQLWTSAFSNVAGSLPLDDVPTFKLRRSLEQSTETVVVARAQLEVTTPGKVKLLFTSADGLSVWVDGAPVDAAKEMVVEMKTGMRTVMVAVDRDKRREPLRLEVGDVSGSAAQVRVVGGK